MGNIITFRDLLLESKVADAVFWQLDAQGISVTSYEDLRFRDPARSITESTEEVDGRKQSPFEQLSDYVDGLKFVLASGETVEISQGMISEKELRKRALLMPVDKLKAAGNVVFQEERTGNKINGYYIAYK